MTQENSITKILVGYDGSRESRRALDFAMSIANHYDGAEIHVAHVVQKPAGAPDPVPDEVMEALRKAARQTLLEAERAVKKSLGTPVVYLEVGSPGETLLGLADRIKPGLVVLGTLERPASERLLGTVSSSFLRSRRHRLLIVP